MAAEDDGLVRRAGRLVGWAARTGASLGQRLPGAATGVRGAGERDEPLRAAMADLLQRSVDYDRERAQDALYGTILRQLAPDEARIVAVLANGDAYPVLDVAERTPVGATGRTVLRNASTVGQAAGVRLAEQVPAYLTRLAGIGLIDLDEETTSLEPQYEILRTDPLVRAAEREVRRAKFVRGTLRISRLGQDFWLACAPSAAERPLSPNPGVV